MVREAVRLPCAASWASAKSMATATPEIATPAIFTIHHGARIAVAAPP